MIRSIRLLLGRAIGAPVLILALGLFGAGAAVAACSEDRVSLRGDWGQIDFSVSVADDPAEQARGLMFVEEMRDDVGMLFTYRSERSPSFWMRNTLIPLDMIFVGSDGVVRRIKHNAQPLDETPVPGGPGIVAVLEINGGLARRYGIREGTELRHPHFATVGAPPAWPCEG